ncbi:MAG: hypothetical protein NTW83_03860 [Cyanobacteria bacterium]|nr:hypothetical protein [Cyanobacteriota bacterium]
MHLLILLGLKFNPLMAYLLKISPLMTNSPMTNSPMTNSPMTNSPMTNSPLTNSLTSDLLKVAGLAMLGA